MTTLLGASSLILAEAIKTPPKAKLISDTKRIPQESKRKVVETTKENPYKWEIVWRNVLAFAYLHTAALYGLFIFLFLCQWKTSIFYMFVLYCASQGITAGAHRLWSHKSYKAKLPLRIILMIFQSLGFQNHIFEWSRDHRVHHKFTDTDADPHNASRGFFFSHMGWLMVKKHKDVREKGKSIDMSDLLEDKVVVFQMKYFVIIMPLFTFVIPTLIPYYFWNENIWYAWYVNIFRYVLQLHGTWSVNSAAHLFGTKPYDKKIGPAQNSFVASVAMGEGWHNYHHVFPWDYKTDEFNEYTMNLTKAFIDFFAKIGWAYDLKSVSSEMIKKRAQRTGDGTRVYEEASCDTCTSEDDHVWGWGDKDLKEDMKKCIEISFSSNE